MVSMNLSSSAGTPSFSKCEAAHPCLSLPDPLAGGYVRELMGMSDLKKDASVLDWDVPALWWGDGIPWGKQDGRDTVCVYSSWVGGRTEHRG